MAGGGGGYGGYNHQSNRGNDNGANGNPSEGGHQLACDCDAICIDTILNSPQQDVLTILKVGDILLVKDEMGKLLALKDKKIAGSLTPPEQAKIISCIAAGYEYNAVVTGINGAACRVQIKPKAS